MTLNSPSLECRLLDASIVAYAIKDGKINPDTSYYQNIGIKNGTTPTVFVDSLENINAGFVAETYDDWVILSYRGTLPPFKGEFWPWILDWLNDFRIGPMDWKVNSKVIGRVETGFGMAVLDTWAQVQSALSSINLYQKKGILVTGHSKGGGMTFPAATLIKGEHPDVHVVNCSFAAPLTCDRNFRTNYDKLGLKPFTVRYQNQYDIVPFLPYYPYFSLLATAERRSSDQKTRVMSEENWGSQLENDYVRIGHLRYLGNNCKTEYGEKGQSDADAAIEKALMSLEFEKIALAHSAAGRYHTCICG